MTVNKILCYFHKWQSRRGKATAFLISPDSICSVVITGFNTDIEYQGITYHVQTEDKGLDTPLILSLVYDRGTILASKRSPYDDLISEGFSEKELAERLQKQHKLICAAIHAGRIEDLKRMTMKESASKQKNLVAQKEIKTAIEIKKVESKKNATKPETKKPENTKPLPEKVLSPPQPPPKIEVVPADLSTSSVEEKIEANIPKLFDEIVWDIPVNIVEEPIIEEVRVVEEETILPAEAIVEVINDSNRAENPLDDKLKIELLTDTNFTGGERKTINIRARRGAAEGLSGAHILVKIVGSSFRPLIFHSKTNGDGIAAIHLQLPHFRTGRAAILIKAMSEGEEAELRRIIKQG